MSERKPLRRREKRINEEDLKPESCEKQNEVIQAGTQPENKCTGAGRSRSSISLIEFSVFCWIIISLGNREIALHGMGLFFTVSSKLLQTLISLFNQIHSSLFNALRSNNVPYTTP